MQVLTIRNISKEQQAAIETAKSFFWHKSASKVLLGCATSYVELRELHSQLQHEFEALQRKHNNLIDLLNQKSDIENQLKEVITEE